MRQNSIRNDASELKEKRKRFWSRSVMLCVRKQAIVDRRTKAVFRWVWGITRNSWTGTGRHDTQRAARGDA